MWIPRVGLDHHRVKIYLSRNKKDVAAISCQTQSKWRDSIVSPKKKWKSGGRGLISITNHYKNTITNFSSYLLNSEEQFQKLLSNWQVTRGEKSVHSNTHQYHVKISHDIQQPASIRKLLRNSPSNPHSPTYWWWNPKENMHKQFAKYLYQPNVSKEWSKQWLKSSSLKRSEESTVAATQEQVISIKCTKNQVFSVEDNDTCRICHVEKETFHHIISGCDGLSPTKYLKHHDNVYKCIHVLLLLLGHGFIWRYLPWYQQR